MSKPSLGPRRKIWLPDVGAGAARTSFSPFPCDCGHGVLAHVIWHDLSGWAIRCVTCGTACERLVTHPRADEAEVVKAAEDILCTSPEGDGDTDSLRRLVDRHRSLGVHSVQRVNGWRALIQHLPVSIGSARTFYRNDKAARLVHPAGTGRVRATGLRSVVTRVWRRLCTVASGLRCVWTRVN